MEDWRLTLALIRDMRRLCRQRGAELIVLLTPDNNPVRWKSAHWFRDVLTAFCKQEGIPCADPDRREEGKPFDFARNCYAFDGHWNWRGHDVAARALAPVIAEALRLNSASRP